jgi:hypothetical protein
MKRQGIGKSWTWRARETGKPIAQVAGDPARVIPVARRVAAAGYLISALTFRHRVVPRFAGGSTGRYPA